VDVDRASGAQPDPETPDGFMSVDLGIQKAIDEGKKAEAKATSCAS
jgi:hypothetical protein